MKKSWKSRSVERATVFAPGHSIEHVPIGVYVFEDEFTEDWRTIGLDAIDDLRKLEVLISLCPRKHREIANSGGVRQVVFRPRKLGKDVVVTFVYYQEYARFVLLDVSLLDEVDLETTNEELALLRRHVALYRHYMENGFGQI